MLCVPPTITLEMECDRPDSAVFDHLIPDLTEFFDPESGAFEDGPIRALEVTQTTPLHNLSITVRCEDATRREPRVVIKLLADPAVCDHDEWIRAQELCRTFPFRDLTSLSLDVTHAVAQGKPFFDGLAEASSLKELHLRHAAAQAFCSAVIAISHEDDNDFLPKLEIISLAMVNFRGKVYQEGRGARRSFYKVFHDWVTRRRESELGLKGLSVKTCTLDPQWFLDLKSLIFETTWDGVRDGHNVGTEGLDDEQDEEEGEGECEDYAEEEEEEEGYDSDDYDEWADRRT
ncbi:hypothetical protein OF83DRAFT_37047 [Amylostereum chailletii]|nr:hypothetical protein OF83DRAFT_37047 [Amylostereum chailletii]